MVRSCNTHIAMYKEYNKHGCMSVYIGTCNLY
jgi:hypothetical protein